MSRVVINSFLYHILDPKNREQVIEWKTKQSCPVNRDARNRSLQVLASLVITQRGPLRSVYKQSSPEKFKKKVQSKKTRPYSLPNRGAAKRILKLIGLK
eukprot:sb/3478640/